MAHIAVMMQEVLTWLNLKPNDAVIDCTLGRGGHARAMLDQTAPKGRLLGFDVSEPALAYLRTDLSSYGKRVQLVHDNFRNLEIRAKEYGFKKVQGILLDLGFSSDELADPKLGLSFQVAGPLDMRLGGEGITAAEIVNSWTEDEIADVIGRYGEERFAARIARAIRDARRKERILTTLQLVEIIKGAVPGGYERGRIHPATRTFQALRIAVNEELQNLEVVLPQAVKLLAPGGRLVVISFHSLEDRIVKRFFRDEAGHDLRVLTKRPVQAGEEEVRRNPRARSAKLRAAEKLT
ncbi:MAG: 16S rRNA (cytosine(1402)-N(4))-methyltransferase RsmH [bacterium]|nr:16S rRNA (cytosine(1402)-N(4))-methyltransferase RsmH [bacterium]